MEYTHQIPSPLGTLFLTSDGEALTGLWMEGQRHFPTQRFQQGTCQPELPVFCQAADWLSAYFAAAPLPERPLLAPEGTPFQRLVWQKLLAIPWGSWCTYGMLAQQVAEELGRAKMSPRGVGSAVGRNPIALLIPCHRVLGAGGRLTGYAGGLERKAWLLRHEGII